MRSNIRATPQLPRLSHQAGNASADGVPFHDWIIGHFVPPELGERSTQHIEIKWGVHDAGEGECEWSVNKAATTISILLRGKDRIDFPDGEVVLDHEGDYAIWGPGVPHRWRAIEPCVVLTVRWPSASNDVMRLSDDELAAYLNDLSLAG